MHVIIHIYYDNEHYNFYQENKIIHLSNKIRKNKLSFRIILFLRLDFFVLALFKRLS